MDVSSSARAHPARHRASTHRIYDASSGQVLVKVIAVSFFEIGLLGSVGRHFCRRMPERPRRA